MDLGQIEAINNSEYARRLPNSALKDPLSTENTHKREKNRKPPFFVGPRIGQNLRVSRKRTEKHKNVATHKKSTKAQKPG